MNYYYLVASLPMLTLGREAPMSSQAFRALCAEHLTPADLAVLDDLLATGGACAGDPFVNAWRERDIRLRNSIVRTRAARLGIDPAAHMRPENGFDAYTPKAVEDAFARSSPADRELDLDRLRWATIEELTGLGAFALPAVLAYALKLRLVERWSRLEAAEGRRRVDEFVAASTGTAAG